MTNSATGLSLVQSQKRPLKQYGRRGLVASSAAQVDQNQSKSKTRLQSKPQPDIKPDINTKTSTTNIQRESTPDNFDTNLAITPGKLPRIQKKLPEADDNAGGSLLGDSSCPSLDDKLANSPPKGLIEIKQNGDVYASPLGKRKRIHDAEGQSPKIVRHANVSKKPDAKPSKVPKLDLNHSKPDGTSDGNVVGTTRVSPTEISADFRTSEEDPGTNRALVSLAQGSTSVKTAEATLHRLTSSSQEQLWSKLLGTKSPPTDSTVTVTALDINETKLDTSSSKRKKPGRLADRLKQDSQPTTQQESSSDDERINRRHSQQIVPIEDASDSRISKSQSQGDSQRRQQTYARSRSYLQATSLDDLLSTSLIPEDINIFEMNKDIDLEDGASQGFRSIHELRAVGTKARILDEMNTLLDEIKNRHGARALSKRCLAIDELSLKLKDIQYMKQFVGIGGVKIILEECSRNQIKDDYSGDSKLLDLLDTLLSCDAVGSAVYILCCKDMAQFVVRFIGNPNPLIIPTNDFPASALQDETESTLQDPQDPRYGDPKVELLALKVLHSMISDHQHETLLDAVGINKLAAVLLKTVVQLVDDTKSNAQSAISILEIESTTFAKDLSSKWPKSALTAIYRSFDYHARKVLNSDWTYLHAAGENMLELMIRLLISTSNNMPINCDLFCVLSTPGHIFEIITTLFKSFSTKESVDDRMFQLLLISLGLSINLTECCDAARASAMQPNSIALDAMLDEFVKGQETSKNARSMQQGSYNVAYGYLCILLGNLCLNDNVKLHVKSRLQSDGIQSLIMAIQEFLRYHKQIDSSDFKGGARDSKETWETFTKGLESMLQKLENAL